MHRREDESPQNMIDADSDEDQQQYTLGLDQEEITKLKAQAEAEFLTTANKTFQDIIKSPERIIHSLLGRNALRKKIQGTNTLLTIENNKVPGEPDHIDPADISAILADIDQQYEIGTNEENNPTVVRKTGITANGFTFTLNESNLGRVIGDLTHSSQGFGISAEDIKSGKYSVSQLVIFNAIIFDSFAHQADFAQKKKTEKTQDWLKQFEKELNDELETYISKTAYPQYCKRQTENGKKPLTLDQYRNWYLNKCKAEDFSTFKSVESTSYRARIDNWATSIQGETHKHITSSDKRKILGKQLFDALANKFPSSDHLAKFVTPTFSIPRVRTAAKVGVVAASSTTGASIGAFIGVFFFGIGAIPGALIGGAIGLALGGIAVAITNAREYFAGKAELARRKGNNQAPTRVDVKEGDKPQSTKVVQQALQQSTGQNNPIIQKPRAPTLQAATQNDLDRIINNTVKKLNTTVTDTFTKCMSNPNKILDSILAREVISKRNGDTLSAPLKVNATMTSQELAQAFADIDRHYEVTFDQTPNKVMLKEKITAANTESTKPAYGLTETTLARALSDLKEHMTNEELIRCSPSQLLLLDAVLSSSLHIAKTRIDEVSKEIKRHLLKENQESLNEEIKNLYGKDANTVINENYQVYLSKRQQPNQLVLSKEDYVLDIFFSEICSSKPDAVWHKKIEDIASKAYITALKTQNDLEKAVAKTLINDFMQRFPNQNVLVDFVATQPPTPNKTQ